MQRLNRLFMDLLVTVSCVLTMACAPSCQTHRIYEGEQKPLSEIAELGVFRTGPRVFSVNNKKVDVGGVNFVSTIADYSVIQLPPGDTVLTVSSYSGHIYRRGSGLYPVYSTTPLALAFQALAGHRYRIDLERSTGVISVLDITDPDNRIIVSKDLPRKVKHGELPMIPDMLPLHVEDTAVDQ